jgi:hypothetical protein
MANDIIYFEDKADTTNFPTITASSTNASYPVTNALNDSIFQPWKSATNGTVYYTFHSSTSITIKAVILLNINIESVEGGDDFDLETSDNNYGAIKATEGFSLQGYAAQKINLITRKSESYTRWNAIMATSLTAKDFRVKMNIAANSVYSIGRIILAYQTWTPTARADGSIPGATNNYTGGLVYGKTVNSDRFGNQAISQDYCRYEFKEIEYKLLNNTDYVGSIGIAAQPYCIYYLESAQLLYGSFTQSPTVNENLHKGAGAMDRKTIKYDFIEKL